MHIHIQYYNAKENKATVRNVSLFAEYGNFKQLRIMVKKKKKIVSIGFGISSETINVDINEINHLITNHIDIHTILNIGNQLQF